jgi:uncharacterized membrane protein (UPF0127 family)
MKWFRLVLVGCLIGFGTSTFFKLYQANPSSCKTQYRHDTTVAIGDNQINAEVAQSDQDKVQGLSGRSCIGENKGMLFVFKESGKYDIWMKDMKFPIDIIWLNESKQAIKVEPNVTPATYPKIFVNERPAMYVLELRATRAQQINIVEGSQLKFNL